jgi:hypothetical protein
MSLSVGERQALHTIESALAKSYPGLAAKLTTFTRLAVDEAMPGHENVSARQPHVMTPQHRVHWRHNRASPLVLWLALAVAVIAASGIGLAISHEAIRPCRNSFALMCTERANPSPSGPSGQRTAQGGRATPHSTARG